MPGRRFAVYETKVMWGSDITYIATSEGWLYLAVFYNRQRLHSSLGYRTPVEYTAAISGGIPMGILAEERAM